MMSSLGSTVKAQQISVDFVSEPLDQALYSFALSNRIDIVFAERQVQGRFTTCRYEGENINDALLCILLDHNLQAIQLRRRQYVLVVVNRDESLNSPEVTTGTLHGFILDAVSKEVLPGAHVYLYQLSIGVVTNEAGHYAIPSMPIGQYHAKISFIGYTVLDTLLEISVQPINILLNQATLETATAFITSDRKEDYSVEPGVQQVPVERLSRLPGFPGEADLLQSLSWFPSIQRVRTNQGGLVIRGGEPDQIQYLIDGAPVYHMWHVGGLLSIYQPEAFKDVRLYRGSFPAEYGGRLSAVLDAELKDGSLDRISGMVGMGLLSARGVLEGPLTDKISFMISGRRSYIDWIIRRNHFVDDGVNQDTMRTGISLHDISTKLTWRISNRQRVSLGVYSSSDILDIRLPVNLSLINASSSILPIRNWLRPSELIFEFDTRWRNLLVSGRYQHLLSDQVFLTLTGYGTSYEATERIFLRPSVMSSVNSMYELAILDVGIKLDLDYYHSLTHHVRAGIAVVQRNFSSALDAMVLRTELISESSKDQSELDNTEIVLYAQDTWKPIPSLQIQPGVRISELRGSTGIRISPRLGVRYEMNKMILRMVAGINVQYLHQVRDRYSVLYDLISYRWVPASRSVDPSASYHVSVGSNVFLGNYFSAGVDVYLHSTFGLLLPLNEEQTKDGLLGPGIGVASILGQYTRGQARSYGAEFNIQYDRGRTNFWMSYATGISQNRAPELGEVHFRPSRFDLPFRLQVALQRTTSRWIYGVSGQWRSGYPITVPEARYAVGDPLSDDPQGFFHFPKINNGRLPSFLNFGVLGAYRFEIRNVKFQVKIEINNLHFHRNVIAREFDPTIPDRTTTTSIYGFPPYPLFEITSRF